MKSGTSTARKLSPAPQQKAKPSKKLSVVSVDSEAVRVLHGAEWLERVQALHAQVRAEMPESQRHWLLPKPSQYFHDLLIGKTGAVLGLIDDGKLAGFMALVWSENFATAHADSRITCPDRDGRLAKLFGSGKVVVAQSMCVLNAYLGRGFSRALIQGAVAWVQKNNYPHFFAQIADQNVLSWLRFLQQDFAIVTTWQSGHRRFLLRRLSIKEKTKLLKQAESADRHSYAKDYAQVPALLTELVARLEQGQIAFLDTASGDPAALPFVFGKIKN